MTDDLTTRRDKIIEHALPHIAFDGWTMVALEQAASDAGYSDHMARRVFTEGVSQAIDHFADWSDRRMVAALATQDLESLKIRERIHACVKTRIQLNAPHKESIRRLLSYLALPSNTPLASRLAWRSCSVMWYAAGDRSSDWNHYTKRGLLVSVYSTTILYWLNDEGDESGDFPETWSFLERRISDVLKTFGLPKKLKSIFSQLPNALFSRRVARDSSN